MNSTDWAAVEAIGVCLAFAAALGGIGYEMFHVGPKRDAQLARQAAESERRAEEDRRRQAAAVMVFPSRPVIDDPRALRNRRYLGLTVHNTSSDVITDLWVVIDESHPEMGPQEVTIDSLEVLRPGSSHHLDVPTDLQVQPGKGPERLIIRFVDVAGRRWQRDAKGGLLELDG